MKYCVDCAHFRRDIPFFWELGFAKCAKAPNPNALIAPLMRRDGLDYCSLVRCLTNMCGESAAWFEPRRLRWWERLFGRT